MLFPGFSRLLYGSAAPRTSRRRIFLLVSLAAEDISLDLRLIGNKKSVRVVEE